MTRATFVAFAMAVLVACSPTKGGFDAESGLAPETDSLVGEDDTASSDTADEPSAWMALDGQLTLTGGVPGALTLSIGLFGDPPEEANCTVSRTAETGEALGSTPDTTVYYWWRFNLVTPDDESGCGVIVPDSLLLGLGALHPEILPALPEHGVDGVADSLYGVYANPYDDGTPAQESIGYAFGFAGTAQDRAGADVAVTAPPMPDGEYVLTGFYLFDLRDL